MVEISTIVREELRPYHLTPKVTLRPTLEVVVVHRRKISREALQGIKGLHLKYLNLQASRIRLYHPRA